MVVTVDGVQYNVPDDATVEEIDSITKPATTETAVSKAGKKALAAGIGATSLMEPLNPVAAGINTVLRKTLGGHLGIPEASGGMGDTWREEMQNLRKGKEWAQKESLPAYMTGALAAGFGGGSAIPMAASKAAGAAPGLLGAGKRALGAVMDSALFSGASAAGANADQDPLSAASSAATSPANLIAAAPTVIGEGAPVLRRALESKAQNIGRRVLLGGYTPMSVKKALPGEVIDSASEHGAFLPWGTTKGAYKRLSKASEDVGEEYGKIVKALEAAGVEGPRTKDIAMAAMAEARTSAANTAQSPRPGMFQDFAEEMFTKMTGSGKLGGALGLEQAENIKRSLQSAAREEYIKLNQNIGAAGLAKKDQAAMMRQAVEDAVEAQAAKAPDLAAQFNPVKNELGPLIKARDAAEVGTSRQAHRRALTPYDMAAVVGGLAHGSIPMAAGTAAGVHLLGSRVPSTATWGLYGAANRLPKTSIVPERGSVEEMILLANMLRQKESQ